MKSHSKRILTTTSWSSTDSGTNVGDEVLHVDSLECLGEEAGPVRLDIYIGGLQDGLNLLTLKNSTFSTFHSQATACHENHRNAYIYTPI